MIPVCTLTLFPAAQCLRPASVAIRAHDGAVIVACKSGGVIQHLDGLVTTLATANQCSSARKRRDSVINGTVAMLANSTQCQDPSAVAIRSNDGSDCRMLWRRRGSTLRFDHGTHFDPWGLPGCFECGDPRKRGLGCGMLQWKRGPSERWSCFQSDSRGPMPRLTGVAVRRADDAVFVACKYSGVIQILNETVTTLIDSNACPSPQSVSIGVGDGAAISACYGSTDTPASRIFRVLHGVKSELLQNNHQICQGVVDASVRPGDESVVAACNIDGGVIQIVSPIVTTLARQCQTLADVSIRRRDGAVIAACVPDGVLQVVNGTTTTLINDSRCVAAAVHDSDGAVVAVPRPRPRGYSNP
jgi:hypothetical protein